MGIFDSLKSSLQAEMTQAINHKTRDAINGINNGIKKTVHNAINCKSEKITFQALPTSLTELQALPECKLDTPFKTTALVLAALCNFEKDEEATWAMLDFLKGPEDVSVYEKQLITGNLKGKEYKPRSYFAGATPKNGYQPTAPFTITVSDNEYSYKDENWATMYVQSGGADSPRTIKLRKKPSTGQWFLNEIQCLSDIRIPEAQDPWA